MLTTRETYLINHPILGPYLQTVCDTPEEAGHKRLPSQQQFGWGMPTDPVTAGFVRSTVGKVVLEIGSAAGDTVVVPALETGARLVFATNIKRESEFFSEDSDMMKAAMRLGRRAALRTKVIEENWWDRDLQDTPTVASLLAIPAGASLPDDATVDLMIARHSAQFGSLGSFLRLLDLASEALRPGGTFTGINFTHYTGYLAKRDDPPTPPTIDGITSQNVAFAAGEVAFPGGMIDDLRPLLGIAPPEPIPFLYFDQPTIIGLLRRWAESREKRGLPHDLTLTSNYYFSPSVIARVNKLTTRPALAERENHVFVLTKVV